MALSHSDFYSAANLQYNPFRSNPVQETDPRMDIWVGYEKEKQQLWKYIQRSRADQVGNANMLMVYGDFGAGKSHALLWAKHQILEARKAEFNSVAYYIQTLRKDAGKLTFAGAFREDIVGKSSIVADVRKLKQFLEEAVVEYKREKGLGPDVSTEAALAKVLPPVELFNFAKEILRCDDEEDVRSLLCPAKLGDYEAMTRLTKLINLFVYEIKLNSSSRRFKNGAYLLIDELDLLATATAKEARDVNELIRHIYDNCPNCFCLVLAFTATAAELNILFAEYVLSRVNKQIVMKYLELEEAKYFVRDILDTARIDQKRKGYIPFDEGAIEAIVSQIVSITPRKIINAMQQVLEELRLADFNPSAGPATATVLDDHGIIEDVLGG